jgi:hypothetical protein
MRAARDMNSVTELKRYRRSCSGGSSIGGGRSGKMRRNSGMMRAISGPVSPSASQSVPREIMRAVASKISTTGA